MKRSNLISASNEAGFTLIEILIAITLLAFITIGVVSVTQNAVDTMDRTTETNKNNLTIETALSRFEWDFSQIYSPLYFSTPLNLSSADPYGATNDANMDGRDDNTGKEIAPTAQVNPMLQEYYQRLLRRFEQNQHFLGVSKEGLPIPRFYSPDKTIFEFFTSSNRRKMENTRQSHFAWVRYTLGEPLPKNDDQEERPASMPQNLKTLMRYFSADDPYDDKRIEPEDARVKGAVLLENVESLEFNFWNPNSRKWETGLNTIPGGQSLLRGVRILMTWYDSTGNKRTISRIYRNHWPLEVPQESTPITPTTPTTPTEPDGDKND